MLDRHVHQLTVRHAGRVIVEVFSNEVAAKCREQELTKSLAGPAETASEEAPETAGRQLPLI